MADGIIRVPVDDAGKRIDTSELTVGANTVERQRVVIASDSTAGNLAAVSSSGRMSVDANGTNTVTTGSVTISAGTPVDILTGQDVAGFAWVSVHVVSNSGASTLTFQSSNDNSNWVNTGLDSSASTTVNAQTTTTVAGIYSGPLSGRYFRVRATTANAGSASIVAHFSSNPTQMRSIGATVVGVGTAGTPSGNLLTIQGHTSGTAVKTDGSATTQPVSMAASTGTLSSVSSSATSVTLLSSNSSRKGAVVFNDSAQVLYVGLTSSAVSSSSFSYKVSAGGTLELATPYYTGQINGIWAAASGSARITELA